MSKSPIDPNPVVSGRRALTASDPDDAIVHCQSMKRKSANPILVLVLTGWLASHLSCGAAIKFVDPAAIGIANGSSWENAFRSLARGIANAGAGDELWVVGGVYYPEDLASGQESLGTARALLRDQVEPLDLRGLRRRRDDAQPAGLEREPDCSQRRTGRSRKQG